MPAHAAAVLPRVGALVEGPAFHPYLSGQANLRRLDAADRTADPRSARRRIGTALERVGLTAAAGKRYRNYSLGMRQRLGIAAALLQPRDLLVLDEPTNGLDPQGTREVRHLISQLGTDGVTVFVSSHLLSEVEQVCTHVGVMSIGRMVWQGSLADLGAQQRVRVRVETAEPVAAAQVLRGLGLGRGHGRRRRRVRRAGRRTAGTRGGRAGLRRCRPARLRCGTPAARGCVRRPDRRGLRCLGLTWSSYPNGPRRRAPPGRDHAGGRGGLPDPRSEWCSAAAAIKQCSSSWD